MNSILLLLCCIYVVIEEGLFKVGQGMVDHKVHLLLRRMQCCERGSTCQLIMVILLERHYFVKIFCWHSFIMKVRSQLVSREMLEGTSLVLLNSSWLTFSQYRLTRMSIEVFLLSLLTVVVLDVVEVAFIKICRRNLLGVLKLPKVNGIIQAHSSPLQKQTKLNPAMMFKLMFLDEFFVEVSLTHWERSLCIESYYFLAT